MARIVVHESAVSADPSLRSVLEAEGFSLTACHDANALLEEVVRSVPDAILYALPVDCRQDLGVLRLIRRAAPGVPLVLLASDDSLDTRRVTQSLRPIYYALCPADQAELRQVLRNAVAGRGRAF
jgi:DNA-binding response OmpR family regulator